MCTAVLTTPIKGYNCILIECTMNTVYRTKESYITRVCIHTLVMVIIITTI